MPRPTVILDEPCAPLRAVVAEFAPVMVFKPARGFLSHPHLLVGDLLDALAAAGAMPPYIYVAASFGGFAALDYAHRYPDRLAGLVLVDASHPNQGPMALAAIPPDKPVSPAVADFKKYLQGFGPVWTESCAAITRIKHLGAVPMIVLAAGCPDMPAELSTATRGALTRGWHELQRRHAARSTRGELRIVPGSGHSIVAAAPEVIVAAVKELVAGRHKV